MQEELKFASTIEVLIIETKALLWKQCFLLQDNL
jgi:hypothetical protein